MRVRSLSACCLITLAKLTVMVVVVGATKGSDIYTSSAQLQLLLNSERSLLRMLKNHFVAEAGRKGSYKSYLRDVESDLQALSNVTSVNHPVDAFLGVKRLHGYKSKYLPAISRQLSEAVSKMLAGAGLAMPDKRDVEGALTSLLRVQATYRLTTGQLTASASSASSSTNLSTSDMVQLAKLAASWHEANLTREWLERAAESAAGQRDLELVWNTRTRLESSHQILSKNLQETSKPPCREAQCFEEKFRYLCRKYRRGFPQMHRREVNKVKPSLQCHYGGERGTYHQRWRVEQVSTSPYIALFHHVISPAEAQDLRDLAFGELERAGTGRGKTHEARTSKIAWLYDSAADTVGRLSRRVKAITGLPTNVRLQRTLAEPFQIVNYGIGGEYFPHHDYYDAKTKEEDYPSFSQGGGNRLATFMFYISSVEEGGATVFPHLDLGVPPIQHAALFWYNLLPDGSPDPRTLHGGCPVFLGQKWVANKWIHGISLLTVTLLFHPCSGQQVDPRHQRRSQPDVQRQRMNFLETVCRMWWTV